MGRGAAVRRLSIWAAAIAVATQAAADPSLSGKRIVIDPGHGTIDFEHRIINTGKMAGNGFPEYRISMEIAQALGKLLEDDGAIVFYTRNPDDFWRESYSPAEDNSARAYLASDLKADALICLHCDWSPRRRFKGVTTFWEKDNSRDLAERIQHQLVHDLKTIDRGVVHDSFTILDHSNVPTVLVENGFMSNRAEGRRLQQPAYQKKIARALATAIRGFFGNRPQGR